MKDDPRFVKGGYRDNDDEFCVEDWKYEVINGDTQLGYRDWVKANREAAVATKPIPYVAFGNDELEKIPPLGKFILCGKCGKKHEVLYGKKELSDGSMVETKELAFYQCGDKMYLAGIKGKRIQK